MTSIYTVKKRYQVRIHSVYATQFIKAFNFNILMSMLGDFYAEEKLI